MGHNVDLGMFGICGLKCLQCKENLDLSEVDIDCDVKTKSPFQFVLSVQCYECHAESEFTFNIVKRGN